jgi:hypothetical protein
MPIPPNYQSRDFLSGQFVYGGVAGLFSLYQVGDGDSTGHYGSRGLNNNPDTMPNVPEGLKKEQFLREYWSSEPANAGWGNLQVSK